jgi:hypothetical protein
MKPPHLPNKFIFGELLESQFDGVCFIKTPNAKYLFGTQMLNALQVDQPNKAGDIVGSDILQHIDEAGFVLNEMNCPLVATATDGSPREVEKNV